MSASTPRRHPALIAHRGMPRLHRENTLPGFLAATAAGADGWELDVHSTADGVVIVHHDAVLPSFSGALAGVALAMLTWAELQNVTVGAAGETIPTLDAVLDAAADIDVYVEVKARAIETAVIACLARHPDSTVAVHSFDHRVAQHIRQAAPQVPLGVPVGILTDSYLVDAPHALLAAGARDFWPHRDMVDKPLVNAIHAVGGRVIVWTVNDLDDARRFATMGVDALCSDVVDDLRRGLFG